MGGCGAVLAATVPAVRTCSFRVPTCWVRLLRLSSDLVSGLVLNDMMICCGW